MANILWSFLNVLLLLGLIYIFFRAAKLVKQHIGWGATLFFVFGLLILVSGKSGTQTSTSSPNLLNGTPKDAPLGNASAVQRIKIGTNKLELLAEYYDEQGVITPRGLYAFVSGFTLGHRWKPVVGSLIPQGKQLRYMAVVSHDWHLLGVNIFNQTQQFDGLMPAVASQ